MVIMIM